MTQDETEEDAVLDYAAFFGQVRRAMANLGFADVEVSHVLQVIVTILSLGEVEFVSSASGVAVSEDAVRPRL